MSGHLLRRVDLDTGSLSQNGCFGATTRTVLLLVSILASAAAIGVVISSDGSYNHVYPTSAVSSTLSIDPFVTGSGLALAPPGSFDFSLSASGPVATYQGISTQEKIQVSLVSGQSQPVSLSCGTPLPQGVSCTFIPQTGTPTFSSTLLIDTMTTTPPGNYTIKVLGSGGGLTRATHFSLTVNPAVPLGGIGLPVNGWRLFIEFFLATVMIIGSLGAVSAYILHRSWKRNKRTQTLPR